MGENAFICRAGLIVGPEDPTGRFTYWPVRLDRGGEVLVPGTPDDACQLIDVRDLAQWIVLAAQTRLTGTFDGIGPSFTRGQFLTECVAAVGASCTLHLGRPRISGKSRHQALGRPTLAAALGPATGLCGLQHARHLTGARGRLDGAATLGHRTRHFGLGAHHRWNGLGSYGRRRERGSQRVVREPVSGLSQSTAALTCRTGRSARCATRRRPARHAGGQRQQGHPCDAGEEAAGRLISACTHRARFA